MKKLMIALTAVAMAAGVQAANVDWSVSSSSLFKNAANSSIAVADNIQAYLCLYSDVENLVTALKNGTLSSTTAGVLDTGTLGYRGEMTKKTSPASSSISDSVANDFAVLLVDSKSVTGKTYYEYSDANSLLGYDAKAEDPSPTEFVLGYRNFKASATGSSGGWLEVQSVPEPTSGLLLLLGVAGLALRRRRA